MARTIPRFLFSNPQNTKSKGPFIVHTIFPRCVIRVMEMTQKGAAKIELLEMWEEDLDIIPSDIDRTTHDAALWLHHQLKSGEVTITFRPPCTCHTYGDLYDPECPVHGEHAK